MPNPFPSNSWPRDFSAITVTKKVVKATPGVIRGIYATNANAAVRYLQIHNKATAPAANDVPVFSFLIPIGLSVLVDSRFFGDEGNFLDAGVSWAISTVPEKFTDSATNTEHTVQTIYS